MFIYCRLLCYKENIGLLIFFRIWKLLVKNGKALLQNDPYQKQKIRKNYVGKSFRDNFDPSSGLFYDDLTSECCSLWVETNRAYKNMNIHLLHLEKNASQIFKRP